MKPGKFLFSAITIFSLTAPLAFARKGTPILELQAVGDVQIGADGHVLNYTLKNKLAPVISALVDKNVRKWTFDPVLIDGKPVIAKTSVHSSLFENVQALGLLVQALGVALIWLLCIMLNRIVVRPALTAWSNGRLSLTGALLTLLIKQGSRARPR